MSVCFSARAYIRFVCFGCLLLEDWLVGAALAILIASAAGWQVYLKHMYNMAHAAEGTYIPGPTFIEDTKVALWACGALAITVHIGLWLIKASFLVLFYRLGRQIDLYRHAWWVCTGLVMACGAASVGLNQYSCMFADINEIFATCLTPSSLHDVYVKEITASVLDVFSDLLSETSLENTLLRTKQNRIVARMRRPMLMLIYNFSYHFPGLALVGDPRLCPPKAGVVGHFLPRRPHHPYYHCEGDLREDHC